MLWNSFDFKWNFEELHYYDQVQDLSGKVLCHPICSQDDDLEAVVELIRTSGNMFTEGDCEVSKMKNEMYQIERHNAVEKQLVYAAQLKSISFNFRLSIVIWSGEV